MIRMVRTLFVLMLVAVIGCGAAQRHPRTSIVGGATVIGAFAFGLPIANECTPDQAGDSGAAHDAIYVAAGAALGALIGAWIAYEWWLQDAGHRAEEAEAPKKR
jgi:hypothetical protein